MEKQDQSLKVSYDTKVQFDKLQFNLKRKGIRKTQDELVEILLNVFKEANKKGVIELRKLK